MAGIRGRKSDDGNDRQKTDPEAVKQLVPSGHALHKHEPGRVDAHQSADRDKSQDSQQGERSHGGCAPFYCFG
jgi:hypothetical protein